VTRVGKAHWLGAVFPKFYSPENIVIRLHDFRRLFDLIETEASNEGWVLIGNPLCERSFPRDQAGYPGEEVTLPQGYYAR
jgi:hypothetical protein